MTVDEFDRFVLAQYRRELEEWKRTAYVMSFIDKTVWRKSGSPKRPDQIFPWAFRQLGGI